MKLLAEKSTTLQGLRVDIQLLRAFAVLLVVFFHLWPNVVRSGFIGVDVFFVISGFLITGHLLREVSATSSIKLQSFWARRIRRLLPSALLVIFVTSLFSYFFVPKALWDEISLQNLASTFYFENWVLAFNSVDYLHAEQQATPVQQYWSLSVEEQFYVIWPLLILTAVWVAGKRKINKTRSITIVLTFVSLLSILFSIVLVAENNATAYFSTFTRAWEFGAGGLTALIALNGRKFKRLPMVYSGVFLLLISVVWISPETPFPGLAAIPPVLGTGLILLAGTGVARPQHELKNYLKPAFWVGGISYSLYLWHWPLIILFPYVTGRELALLSKLSIFAAAIMLAWISTKFLERPIIRSPRLSQYSPARTMLVFLVVAFTILVPTAVATIYNYSISQAEEKDRHALTSDSCYGVKSLENGLECLGRSWPLLAPAPAKASKDLSVLYDNNHECISDTSKLIVCSFGDKSSTKRALLVGDSHAAQWFPALDEISKRDGYRLDVVLRFSCVYLDAPRGKDFQDCEIWSQSLSSYLEQSPRYDLMFVSSWASNLSGDIKSGSLSREEAIDGFHRVWNPLVKRGTTVIVIRDIPELASSPSECLEQVPQKMAKCAVLKSSAFINPDVQFEAAQNFPGVKSIDLTDAFCNDQNCFTMVGGIVVYLDLSHMNKTYAHNLSDYLGAKINSTLEKPGK
ncbi:peptidoglycan/LPS O-acetylase OafA/YrhL [Aurantimicrobium minutum]|nr:peptidoglycan/LPS O-acetylase OafA/YrhL [Aurantimicrobium minutum]